MATPDQPHGSPEGKAKPSNTTPIQAGIDTREKHKQVIRVLKDPEFGLTDLLKGKDTLSPQQVASIWRGENLKLIHGFPAEGTAEQKQAYLNQNGNLKALIEQTRQILTAKANSGNKEADSKSVDPDAELEKELKAVPGTQNIETKEKVETLAERNRRISEFTKTNFPTCPPESLDKVNGECLAYEDQAREFMDPKYELSKLDVTDLTPSIEKIIKIAANDEKIAAATKKQKTNETVIAREEAGDKKDKIEIKQETDKTPILKKSAESTEAKEVEAKVDLQTIKENYPEPLRSKHGGSIGAVKALMGMMKSTKMRTRIDRIIGVMGALQNVIPGKRALTTRLLNQSNLNVGADSITQIFSQFSSAVDNSDEYSDEEKKAIRRVIGQSEKDFQTGSDAKKIAHSKEQVIDPETGEVISEKYVHDSPESMAKIREYMGTYMDGERMMLVSTNGSFPPRDVTGYGPDDLGLLAEALEFHSAAEQNGATGFVESIGNLHYDVLGNGAFNRKKLIETRQVISALMGPFEGHDGKVMDARQKFGLIKSQMRVIPKDGQAISFHNDEAGTKANLEELGLQQNGKTNLKVMKAFGDYTRERFPVFSRKDVQAHLHKLFPSLVKDPNKDDEDGDDNQKSVK